MQTMKGVSVEESVKQSGTANICYNDNLFSAQAKVLKGIIKNTDNPLMAKEICSLYRLIPGPEVAVIVLKPAMEAPRQKPMEAISSSPCRQIPLLWLHYRQ